MNKALIILASSLILLSCKSTKYTYEFEKDDNIDFSTGKWILNDAYLDQPIPHFDEIAYNEFKDVLSDSLYGLSELRMNNLIGTKISFEPTTDELKDIRIGSNYDYLITTKGKIIKEEMGSFSAPPPIGRVTKYNEAGAEIRIYDLRTQNLISSSSAYGRVKAEIGENDSGWDYVSSSNKIARKAISNLIREYAKRNKNR